MITVLIIPTDVTHYRVNITSIPSQNGSVSNYRIFRSITRALSIQKRSKFVKNEHARYTLGMKKGKNLERLITATSQARF